MHFDPAMFRIDPTPRRADGEYMAHAMISGPLPDGESFIHVSGDLAGFDLRQDAIQYATDWANNWLQKSFDGSCNAPRALVAAAGRVS
ncbi:hypothetical protein [Paraburkholderia terrae]|uniref:hypothetical protein n=1 Tax=Paraburkholderia terrae TaxID=311230 RepID=UPI001EE1EFCF|nr:hypothetical protein [Paraburkholderia terrae]GJH05247.1 hypothetical protein CBA19C8_31840 [Paraburkholderia terrae]